MYNRLMFMGILYLFLTFLFCFILVHVVRLAYLGFLGLRKKEEKPPEDKAAPPKTEPVYYIVEKKRAKKSYSSPREIQFKK